MFAFVRLRVCEDDVFGAWKGLFCVAIALLLERKPMGFAPKVAE